MCCGYKNIFLPCIAENNQLFLQYQNLKLLIICEWVNERRFTVLLALPQQYHDWDRSVGKCQNQSGVCGCKANTQTTRLPTQQQITCEWGSQGYMLLLAVFQPYCRCGHQKLVSHFVPMRWIQPGPSAWNPTLEPQSYLTPVLSLMYCQCYLSELACLPSGIRANMSTWVTPLSTSRLTFSLLYPP